MVEAARIMRNRSFLDDPDSEQNTRITLDSISRCIWRQNKTLAFPCDVPGCNMAFEKKDALKRHKRAKLWLTLPYQVSLPCKVLLPCAGTHHS